MDDLTCSYLGVRKQCGPALEKISILVAESAFGTVRAAESTGHSGAVTELLSQQPPHGWSLFSGRPSWEGSDALYGKKAQTVQVTTVLGRCSAS